MFQLQGRLPRLSLIARSFSSASRPISFTVAEFMQIGSVKHHMINAKIAGRFFLQGCENMTTWKTHRTGFKVNIYPVWSLSPPVLSLIQKSLRIRVPVFIH
jgi:hypothetical protein